MKIGLLNNNNLLAVIIIGLCISGCSTGFIRDYIIAPEFGVGNSFNEKVKQVENHPTTHIKLINRSSIKSEVSLSYDFYGRVEPHDPKGEFLKKKRYTVNIDVPPHDSRKVEVPTNLAVRVKVVNCYIHRNHKRTINSGSAILDQEINVIPPGAKKTWNDKKSYASFFNPAKRMGTVTVEPLSSNKFAKDESKHSDKFQTTTNIKLREQKGEIIKFQLDPGETRRLYLRPAFYKISLITNHSRHVYIQAANGEIYNVSGNQIFDIFRLPGDSGEPGVDSYDLDVPNN